jgi:hypothetical protein
MPRLDGDDLGGDCEDGGGGDEGGSAKVAASPRR